MTEWEKVTKGLESIWKCISPVSHTCADCPYQDNRVGCKRRVVTDALALLKEQENGIEPKISKEEDGYTWYYCGKCGYEIDPSYENYCPTCGTKIKGEL